MGVVSHVILELEIPLGILAALRVPVVILAASNDGMSAADSIAQVLSPCKNVVLFAVPEPNRAAATVPLERLVAFNEVSEAPEPENVVAVNVPTMALDHVASPLRNVAVDAVPPPR